MDPHKPSSYLNLYDVLGVPTTAAAQEIDDAYRRRKTSGEWSVIEAYAVLSNPQQRQSYDALFESSQDADERFDEYESTILTTLSRIVR